MDNRLSLVASLTILTLCAIAMADSSAGWQYGGANCGCVNNSSANLISCKKCCRDGAINGGMQASDLGDCLAFCNQAVFPCLPKNGLPVDP